MKCKVTNLLFLLAILTPLTANSNTLKSLSRTSDEIKRIRTDIRTTIYTVKSNRDATQIPELAFYKYRLQKGDTFWNIIARTTLNIDTLMTVNQLENPKDIAEGADIFIPNMRGVIYRVKKEDTLNDIAMRFKVNPIYIKKVNKINSLEKEYLFIPCGSLTKDQRSFFLGSAFRKPLDRFQVTSNFGRRIDPFLKIPAYHSGIDLRCKVGTAVRAARAGKITFCGTMSNYGTLIIVTHSNGYITYYGHLSSTKVKKGDHVRTGEIIALSGNSGRSTGPHLHFEVRKNGKIINPLTLLR